ncbi:MAG: molybdenum cofactor biosynthesis protein MoaB [Methanosarcinales archaeon]|nr:molybdenum cofactor biosynthesis protein MoaB [Methanosarcinales archaeon]
MDTSQLHKKNAPESVRFAIVTVSSSRYKKYGNISKPDQAEDVSGQVISNLLGNSGFEITKYSLLPDNKAQIRRFIQDLTSSDIQAIVISGGTGLAPEDVTLEAVEPLFNKTIPGFGEFFRQKSLVDVGTAALLSRAAAGIVDTCVVFCLPGSPAAVELGVKELIIPEAGHILKHISQD